LFFASFESFTSTSIKKFKIYLYIHQYFHIYIITLSLILIIGKNSLFLFISLLFFLLFGMGWCFILKILMIIKIVYINNSILCVYHSKNNLYINLYFKSFYIIINRLLYDSLQFLLHQSQILLN
jgi:hypothetical protein